MNPDLQLRLIAAFTHHQQGRVTVAEPMYREILGEDPGCFDALHLLGIIACARGEAAQAIDLIGRALAVRPDAAAAHLSFARALLVQRDPTAALAALERALALDAALADAWILRGNVLYAQQRCEEAAASYERAAHLDPGRPDVHCNLAATWRALRATPRGLASAQRALALAPRHARALNNRGLLLLDDERPAEAAASLRAAVAADPAHAEAWHNLGTALLRLRQFPEARDAFAQLARLDPGFPHVDGNRLHAQLCACDWSDLADLTDRVTSAVARGAHADVPLSFLCATDSAELQLRCARTYAETYHPLLAAPAPAAGVAGVAGRGKIRVAYVSGDFGEHPVSYLLAGVIERHDAGAFEIVGMSWHRHGDGELRARLEAAFPRFIDITATSDAQAAQILRELEIDIAVDLTGHTLGARTGIFARRPARIQVNCLGLPATMGASYMDYIVVDRCVLPEYRRQDYRENPVWLPCFQPYDDRRRAASHRKRRSDEGLPERGFVFCCFNASFKLHPTTFSVWMRLLAQVPDSVLWLLAPGAAQRTNLAREAAARGVEPQRLVFAERVPYRAYLARYALADLFLDTLPFNGGTTAGDALSMGLPVLTCSGEAFAARMAASLVKFLGLDELVCATLADYEATAAALARDRPRLRALARRLQYARGEHAFFDTDRYRRELESAYRTMWERSRAGLAPAPFAVAAG